MDSLKDNAHYFPFMLGTGGGVRPDWSAIVQGLVIAVVTALATSQILVIRLDEQFKSLTSNYSEFKQEAKNRLNAQELADNLAQQERILLRERIRALESDVYKKRIEK